MRFLLTIDCANAAFDNALDVAQPTAETVRLLRYAADRIEAGPSRGKLLDANGNTVGRFGFARSTRRAGGLAMRRTDRHDRETFVAALLAAVPTATRAHALRLLRWGTTYWRLCEQDCNGDSRLWEDGSRMLDSEIIRAERIIRETCDAFGAFTNLLGRPKAGDSSATPWVTPHFQGDPRGHTVRLQIAGAPLDERPALAVPTS